MRLRRRLARAARRRSVTTRRGALSAVRAAAYRRPDAAWLAVVPAPVRRRFRLDPPPPGQRRVEIGAGFSPRPGYVHVDVVPFTDDIDLVASGDRLPLPAGWADELLSVHMIEHVPPPRLVATLRHWHDVLTPGGRLTIHTPNGAALGAALVEAGRGAAPSYWPAMSAVFGYGRHPAETSGPEGLRGAPDHKLVLTLPWLQALLEEAGFVEVRDVSGTDEHCHHTRDWKPYVDGLCLEVTARRS